VHLPMFAVTEGRSGAGLEDGIYRIGKYTLDERRLRILRYRQKRNERNFDRKIKYACRKTLADSRPRVRGRFAKNDDGPGDGPPAGSYVHDAFDDAFGEHAEHALDAELQYSGERLNDGQSGTNRAGGSSS